MARDSAVHVGFVARLVGRPGSLPFSFVLSSFLSIFSLSLSFSGFVALVCSFAPLWFLAWSRLLHPQNARELKQQKQNKIINFTSSLSPFMDKTLFSAHFYGFKAYFPCNLQMTWNDTSHSLSHCLFCTVPMFPYQYFATWPCLAFHSGHFLFLVVRQSSSPAFIFHLTNHFPRARNLNAKKCRGVRNDKITATFMHFFVEFIYKQSFVIFIFVRVV